MDKKVYPTTYQRGITATKYHEVSDCSDFIKTLCCYVKRNFLDGMRLDNTL